MLKKIKILLIIALAMLTIGASQQTYSMGNDMDIDDNFGYDNIHFNINERVYSESDDFIINIESGDLNSVQEMVNLNPALLTQKYNLSTELQIEHNNKLSHRNSFLGLTPLHLACHYGQINIVKYLVKEKKLSIDAQDECGWLPVLYASLNDHLDIVQYLCENGPYINLNLCKLTFSKNIPSEIDENHAYISTIDIIEKFSKLETSQYLKTQEDSILKKLIKFHNIIASNNYDNFLQIMRELEMCFPTTNSLFKNFIFFISRIEENSPEELILKSNLLQYKYFPKELTCLLDPLQLAVAVGNINIVKYFIEEKHIDPKNIRYLEWNLWGSEVNDIINDNQLENYVLEHLDAYADLKELETIPPIIHLAPTVELVKYFISKGYTGNELTEYDLFHQECGKQDFMNLITSAAYYGKKEILEFLINELKFNPNTGEKQSLEKKEEYTGITPIATAFNSQQTEIIELLTKKYNMKINEINNYAIFNEKFFKNHNFLTFILLKIKEENGGKFNLNHFRDYRGRTIPNAIIDEQKLLSHIICNILKSNNNTELTYENNIRRLIGNRTLKEDMDDVFIELLKACLEICECTKIALKNAPAFCKPDENHKIYFDFPNNLANCLIVFNILSGTHAVREETINGITKAKTVSDKPLNYKIAANIMSFVDIEKTVQPKEKEPKKNSNNIRLNK